MQSIFRNVLLPGPVAQRSEQGTHNPLVGGSNPPRSTIFFAFNLYRALREFRRRVAHPCASPCFFWGEGAPEWGEFSLGLAKPEPSKKRRCCLCEVCFFKRFWRKNILKLHPEGGRGERGVHQRIRPRSWKRLLAECRGESRWAQNTAEGPALTFCSEAIDFTCF